MSTITTTPTPIPDVAHVTDISAADSVRCDRSGCPAPATYRVEVQEQDFYFCGHHWHEMSASLLGTEQVPWT